jgi:hypothetical protein
MANALQSSKPVSVLVLQFWYAPFLSKIQLASLDISGRLAYVTDSTTRFPVPQSLKQLPRRV